MNISIEKSINFNKIEIWISNSMKITHLILPNPNNLTGTLIWDKILIISCTNRNHKISRKFDKKNFFKNSCLFVFIVIVYILPGFWRISFEIRHRLAGKMKYEILMKLNLRTIRIINEISFRNLIPIVLDDYIFYIYIRSERLNPNFMVILFYNNLLFP